MAVKTSWYAVDPMLGINFNQSYLTTVNVASSVTSNSTTSDINESMQLIAPDALGTSRKGTDNSEWILLKASTTITQFMLVMYDDSYNANGATIAGVLSGYQLALCQVQTYNGVTATSVDPGSNPVFWAMLRGAGAQIQMSGSAGTGVALNFGSAAGQISICATNCALKGIMLYASGASAVPVECMVLYPRGTVVGG